MGHMSPEVAHRAYITLMVSSGGLIRGDNSPDEAKPQGLVTIFCLWSEACQANVALRSSETFLQI